MHVGDSGSCCHPRAGGTEDGTPEFQRRKQNHPADVMQVHVGHAGRLPALSGCVHVLRTLPSNVRILLSDGTLFVENADSLGLQ